MNFKGVHASSEHMRQQKDREMAQLIQVSNEAYATRDEKKMTFVRLKNAEKQDVEAYQERLNVLNEQIEGQRLTQGRTLDAQTGIQSGESAAGGTSDQHNDLQALTDQYIATIQLLLDKSGMKEINDLFAGAERLERENFSLYSYVIGHGAAKMKLQEDIDGLDLRHKVLVAQTQLNEEGQSEDLESLTGEIQEVEADLSRIRDEKAHNESEFSAVYVQIEKITNALGCPWDETPDGKTTTTAANAFHCLSLAPNAIAKMVKKLYEKTKQECNVKDIKPACSSRMERRKSERRAAQ
jgi:hypothetical protein